MKIYAIVDRKAKSLVSVFTSLNDQTAERSFLMLLSSPTPSLFTDFPEDFDLYPVADLEFSGNLTVTDQTCSQLNANGFNAHSYSVFEAIKCGADFDKRYLNAVRADRLEIASLGKEDSDDDSERAC